MVCQDIVSWPTRLVINISPPRQEMYIAQQCASQGTNAVENRGCIFQSCRLPLKLSTTGQSFQRCCLSLSTPCLGPLRFWQYLIIH